MGLGTMFGFRVGHVDECVCVFLLSINMEKVEWWTNLPKQLMSVVPLTSLPSFCLKASSSNSASKKASAPGSLVLHKTHTNTHKRKQRRKKNRI